MKSPLKLAVLGGGAWGTALAATAARQGHQTVLWARDEKSVAQINQRHENPTYLPKIVLPTNLQATCNLEQACHNASHVLAAIPAQVLGKTIGYAHQFFEHDTVVLNCAKGIDQTTGRRMSEMIGGYIRPENIAVLSGPSFADDVASGLPTAVTIAAQTYKKAQDICTIWEGSPLRTYASEDIIGVEWGGALKNILAIAAGIAHGRGLGESAKAALIARGFSELTAVSTSLGGKADTLVGLSGLGDIVLTCGSEKSRNFSYGVALGRGQSLKHKALAEGALCVQVAAKIITDHKLHAPIIRAIADILANKLTVDEAIHTLLNRPLKSEITHI